jgi:protein ImuA
VDVTALVPTVECEALIGSANPAWQPGSDTRTFHCEIFAPGGQAAGAGLALALGADHLAARARVQAERDPAAHGLRDSADQRAILWVQDEAAIRLGGRPYRPGLPPAWRHRLIHVAARDAKDALFALEEGLQCRDIAFVVGELAGNPQALGFTQSRRLSMAAERHKVPLYLIRLDAMRDLSSARQRWDVRAAPSPPPRWNAQAPGHSTWHADLFRARYHRPAQWIIHDEADRLTAVRPGRIAANEAGDSAGQRTPSAASDSVGMAGAAGLRSLAT